MSCNVYIATAVQFLFSSALTSFILVECSKKKDQQPQSADAILIPDVPAILPEDKTQQPAGEKSLGSEVEVEINSLDMPASLKKNASKKLKDKEKAANSKKRDKKPAEMDVDKTQKSMEAVRSVKSVKSAARISIKNSKRIGKDNGNEKKEISAKQKKNSKEKEKEVKPDCSPKNKKADELKVDETQKSENAPKSMSRKAKSGSRDHHSAKSMERMSIKNSKRIVKDRGNEKKQDWSVKKKKSSKEKEKEVKQDGSAKKKKSSKEKEKEVKQDGSAKRKKCSKEKASCELKVDETQKSEKALKSTMGKAKR